MIEAALPGGTLSAQVKEGYKANREKGMADGSDIDTRLILA